VWLSPRKRTGGKIDTSKTAGGAETAQKTESRLPRRWKAQRRGERCAAEVAGGAGEGAGDRKSTAMAACCFNSTAKEKRSAGRLDNRKCRAKEEAENGMRAAGGSRWHQKRRRY